MTQNTQNKHGIKSFLIALVIFSLGFGVGIGLTVYKTKDLVTTTAANSPAAHEHGANNPPAIDHEALHKLEDLVKKDPNNLDAWIQLSHTYYDMNMLDKAIVAYTKTVELDPKNANQWTDLGVMYRRTGNPQKAIECFKTAMDIDSKHEASRFNTGIVLLYDLKDRDGAIKAFESVLAINPEAKSSNGGQVAEFVEYLKNPENKF